MQLVLGDLALLLRCLELVQCIAADVAERNLCLLTGLGNALDKLLTALLGQRREVQTNLLAVVLRVDAEVGDLDRLLDGLEHRAVPRLDGQRARVGSRNCRNLIQRGRCTVILNGDLIENRRVCAACADCCQLLGEHVQRFLHFCLVGLDLFLHYFTSSTIVPIFSPLTAR